MLNKYTFDAIKNMKYQLQNGTLESLSTTHLGSKNKNIYDNQSRSQSFECESFTAFQAP